MNTRTQRRRNGGFTLLEILLTTVVLLVGLTAVFQTTKLALQRMAISKELTEAQNACQAVLNELLAQSAPIQPEPGKRVAHLPNWKIQVDIYPASQSGLYVLHLSALQFSPEGDTFIGVKYQLLRWVPAERVQLPTSDETFGGSVFDDLFQ
jgi:prepilin-type N-terminal cleavage/methylation domain-containing protein